MQKQKQARNRIPKGKPKILGVRIVRECDTDADTSHLGEYSDRATSPFSIDRMHAEDCQSLEVNHAETVAKLERIIGHLKDWYNKNLGTFEGALGDSFAHREAEALDDAEQTVVEAQEEAQECDCGGSRVSCREYRYFNPSRNYVDASGEALPENTPEDVRKYVREDYDRMESLNRGGWSYLGIRAEARIGVPNGMPLCYTVQTIRSGGLWGIESDSERSYFAEVGKDELDNLKHQLLALGFSRRAISQALKSPKEVDA